MKKLITYIFVIVVLLVILWPLLLIFNFRLAHEISSRYIGEIEFALGVNPYLAKAIIIVATVVLFLVFRYLFSWNAKWRWMARGILLALLTGYYLLLWAISDIWYDADGRPLKCFVQDATGKIAYYPLRQPGMLQKDQRTGRPCVPVTPEIRERLKIIESVQSAEGIRRVERPAKDAFFDPISGRPKLWYERGRDGEFIFYNAPVFNPATGRPLQPVTAKTLNEYEQWILYLEKKRALEKDRKKRLEAKNKILKEIRKRILKKKEERARERKREEAKRKYLQHMRSLLVISAMVDISKEKPLALEIVPTDLPEARQAQIFLLAALRDRTKVISPLWKKAFHDEGHWQRLIEGDLGPAIESGLFDKVAQAVVAILSAQCRPWNSPLGKMIRCRVSITGKLINKNGMRNISFMASDAHALLDYALQRAAEKLANKLQDGF